MVRDLSVLFQASGANGYFRSVGVGAGQMSADGANTGVEHEFRGLAGPGFSRFTRLTRGAGKLQSQVPAAIALARGRVGGYAPIRRGLKPPYTVRLGVSQVFCWRLCPIRRGLKRTASAIVFIILSCIL
jgi:hypothetical protein